MIVTRAGHARFQTKNTTARNNTTPIHWAEPGSLKSAQQIHQGLAKMGVKPAGNLMVGTC